MASLVIAEVRMERRPANVHVNLYYSRKLKIPEGVYRCHVLGLFQDSEDGYQFPVFVCELNSGNVITTRVDNVVFVDTCGGDEQ